MSSLDLPGLTRSHQALLLQGSATHGHLHPRNQASRNKISNSKLRLHSQHIPNTYLRCTQPNIHSTHTQYILNNTQHTFPTQHTTNTTHTQTIAEKKQTRVWLYNRLQMSKTPSTDSLCLDMSPSPQEPSTSLCFSTPGSEITFLNMKPTLLSLTLHPLPGCHSPNFLSGLPPWIYFS